MRPRDSGGDFGGTHTRLALASPRGNAWSLSRFREFPTGGDAGALVRRFLKDTAEPGPERAAFCGAGPVAKDGSIRLTNAEVTLDPAALAAAAGLQQVILVNDFAAIGHAVPRLPPEALRHCGGGAATPGAAKVIIGPGTGLGVSIVMPVTGGWFVIEGDGGHADLAPVDEGQLDAWRRLRATHGRVAAETVLSGPGLERLYAALSPDERRTAVQIAADAWLGEERAARGGVFIAGGIVPRWAERFDVALFRAAFEDKAPYAPWLRAIPSFIVTYPQPGLLGLSALAGASPHESLR